MMCSVCRQGETHPGTTTVTLERGEEYLDSSTTEQVMRMAEEAAASGVRVDIRAVRAA